MQLTQEVGLLEIILPELKPVLPVADEASAEEWQRTLHKLHLLQDPGFELAVSALWQAIPNQTNLAETAAELGQRWRMSNDEIEHIAWLLKNQRALDDAPHLPLCQLKRLLAKRQIEDLLKLLRVERITQGIELKPVIFCEEYLRVTPPEEINPPPLLTGKDLIALGLKPGPEFKDILETVRDAQLGGEIHTREEALALVKRGLG